MEENVIDVAKIKMAVKSGIPLVITTYTLPRSMEFYMGKVLDAFFREAHQENMTQYLIYCLSELINNAKKANTKRIYFKEKQLNIDVLSDYEEGMKTFKGDMLANINYYLEKQKEAGLYIKLLLQIQNNYIILEVENNSKLTYFEFKRIHDKICRAQLYNSVEETIDQILDESEGAGLGLVIMILMLKKLGMSEENFKTICDDKTTKTQIKLPFNKDFQSNVSIVEKEFEKTIENLPQFPDNISKLNDLLNEKNSDISKIAFFIGKNVTLTGEILRIVNSAAFGLQKQCGNIMDAVKFIGLNGVQNLLYSIGTLEVFSKVDVHTEELWKHSYKVAFYSYNLAKNFFKSQKSLAEDAYLCGLLHDMGKIIFECAHPKYLEKVKTLCIQKGIDAGAFESAVSGVNHGELGASVAEKWNFPKHIVNAIRYHHLPYAAPEDVQMLDSIIYFADMITHFEIGEVDFYQINHDVLDIFKVSSQTQFESLVNKLKVSYENQVQ